METRKCIIDPNGDAIICLRNFDPPFAVLGTDEELFVLKKMKSLFGTASSGTTAPSGPGGFAGFGSGGLFGNAPSGTTAPSGSTAPPGSFGGMFGNAPSGSTAPSGFAGMFGNAPSSTTIPPSSFAGMFGNAPSGSPAPSGSDAFAGFGSGGFFGSASSPDSAGAAGAAPSGSTSTAFSFGNIPGTQTQSPSDGIEKESSRVAPQGPSENAVKPEEQTEPSTATPELHLQVSSAHLKLASRYFQKAFDGDFQESKRDVDGFLCVDASDWNREALIIVLRIIHGQNRQVPKVLDLEMLAKVAIIVDYYDCHELFDAFAELWLLRLKHRFILLHKLDRELILLLLVSWVFRWESEFKLATKIVLRQSKGPLNTLKLPIPEEITSALDTRRQQALLRIGFVIRGFVTRFKKEPPPCSFECASMNLGALSRQMHQKRELENVAQIFAFLEGLSIVSTMEAARSIQSPNWSCNNRQGPCNLGLMVKSEIDKLEDVDGLNLGDLVQTA